MTLQHKICSIDYSNDQTHQECFSFILSQENKTKRKTFVFSNPLYSSVKKFPGLEFSVEKRVLKLYKHVALFSCLNFVDRFQYGIYLCWFVFKHKANAHNSSCLAWIVKIRAFRHVFGWCFRNGVNFFSFTEIWSELCWLDDEISLDLW